MTREASEAALGEIRARLAPQPEKRLFFAEDLSPGGLQTAVREGWLSPWTRIRCDDGHETYAIDAAPVNPLDVPCVCQSCPGEDWSEGDPRARYTTSTHWTVTPALAQLLEIDAASQSRRAREAWRARLRVPVSLALRELYLAAYTEGVQGQEPREALEVDIERLLDQLDQAGRAP